MNFNSDKTTERERYNSRAINSINSASKINISSVPRFLQSPYICYQEYLSKILSKDLIEFTNFISFKGSLICIVIKSLNKIFLDL